MSWTDEQPMAVGTVQVVTTSNGGHPPEFFAERIVDKLIRVADTAPQPIRDQAHAFREQMKVVVLDGIKRAIASDRAYQTHLMLEKGK
jgi:hypothetical protein